MDCESLEIKNPEGVECANVEVKTYLASRGSGHTIKNYGEMTLCRECARDVGVHLNLEEVERAKNI